MKLGYVGITIDYRLSDTALFPAQIDDVKAAIAFVRTHARDYGQTVPLADSERLAAALKNAGVDVDFQVVKGADHFGPVDVSDQPPEREAIIVGAMERFLRRVFGE